MAWTFGLCDLDGTPIGGITEAYERRLTLPLNGLPTASCRLSLTDHLADEILSRDGDVLLKIYGPPSNTLWFIGDLTTAEEVSQAEQNKPPSLACNFAGPLWRLSKRLVGKGATPPSAAFEIGSQDLGEHMDFVLQQMNDEGDTGIRRGAITASVDSAYSTTSYKPVSEMYAELAALKVFPFDPTTTWTISDDFVHGGAGGDVNGRALQFGTGNWTKHPTGAISATVEPTNVLQRTATGDASFVGAYFAAGTSTYSDVLVQVDANFSVGPTTLGARQGVFARGFFDGGGSRWLMAVMEPYATSLLTVYKCNYPGTTTQLAQATLPPLSGAFHTIRLQVEASGNFYCWAFIGGGSGTMLVEGHDADLATGGALQTGLTGIHDEFQDAFGNVRQYNDYRVAIPSATVTLQGVDFELAPTEPTTDVDGVQIADLNTAPMIGTSKPNVVFEYGGGSRSMKSYRRVLSREGIVNRAYVLDPSDLDVKVATDATSIQARGRFEEVVPSDLADAGLRQAWADQNISVRGTARQIITFEPSANAPAFGTDYIVGDLVTARATAAGTVRFGDPAIQFRVYGIELTIDDEGKEVLTPTLVPE